MGERLELKTVENTLEALLHYVCKNVSSHEKVCIYPYKDSCQRIVEALKVCSASITCLSKELDAVEISFEEYDTVIHWEEDPSRLQTYLHCHINATSRRIVIPSLPGCGLDRPIFATSIPKAGTHLVIELLRSLGFSDGIEYSYMPRKGKWYWLLGEAHTKPQDLCINGHAWTQPLGYRMQAVTQLPILFMFRHPFDILLSEANYFHKPGSSLFFRRLENIPFDKRLELLANDPYLFGTLRDRILPFSPWLDFSNVLPLSYEDLVGDEGGGDSHRQRKLVWAIMLKLQVGGDPDLVKSTLYNTNARTFFKSQIGRHREFFTDGIWNSLRLLNKDYLELFGYSGMTEGSLFSSRTEEFLQRHFKFFKNWYYDTPSPVEYGYMGWNITLYNEKFFAVKQGFLCDFENIDKLIDGQNVFFDYDIVAVKNRIAELFIWNIHFNAQEKNETKIGLRRFFT